MERKCLDCSEVLKGRADKKFCDDQCRSNYNNRLKTTDSNLVREVNAILRKNRSILQQLNPDGKTKISREKLVQKGFSFAYFTSVYQTQKGNTYHFCYEYGYLKLEGDDFLLVKKEEGHS
jgi:dipeptidase